MPQSSLSTSTVLAMYPSFTRNTLLDETVRKAVGEVQRTRDRDETKRGNWAYGKANLEALSVIARFEEQGFVRERVCGWLENVDASAYELLPPDELKALDEAKAGLILPLVDSLVRLHDRLVELAAKLIPSGQVSVHLRNRGEGKDGLPLPPTIKSLFPDKPIVAATPADDEATIYLEVDAVEEIRTSSMCVPILTPFGEYGRKPILMGHLCWQDRKCPFKTLKALEGGGAYPFDQIDLAVAKRFAKGVAQILTISSAMTSTQRLSELILGSAGRTLPEFFEDMLGIAKVMVGADRGDLWWRDPQKQQLVLVAKVGPKVELPSGSLTKPLELGARIPESSVSATVFKTGLPIVIPDVKSGQIDAYVECDSNTRAEVCLPLRTSKDSEPFAILNLESYTPSFFDNNDLNLLRRFNKYAALAKRFTDDRQGIYESIGMSSKEPLRAILQSIHSGMGYEHGAIFILDPGLAVLKLVESSTGRAHSPERTFVRLDEKDESGKSPFLVQLYNDRQPRSEVVGPKSLLYDLGAKGTVIGAPLMLGGGTRVGCLVVWNSDKNRKTKPDDCLVLEHYARLSLTTGGTNYQERIQREIFDFLRKVLMDMQDKKDYREMLDDILEGVVHCGFDRARVFRYEATDTTNRYFECVASYGIERRNEYVGKRLYISNNVYSKMVEVEGELGDKKAKVRYPEQTGLDPNNIDMGKPEDLPWAVGPLTVNNAPKGYIAADNKGSRALITQNNLDHLEVFGALASLVLSRSGL